MGTNTIRYLPPQHGSMRRFYHEIFISLAYDIWRRIFARYTGWTRANHVDILECGPGPGYMLKCIKRWYPNARSIGLDLDRLLIREARAQVPKATFVEGSALDIPLKNESVDLVIALHLVEHLPNPDRFMQEVRRILKPRGVLIIATPNPSGICANLMGTKWNGWSDHTHVNLQPPNYWRKLLRDHDLSILKDGTTALSGIPILRKMPFALINQIPLFLFGMFSWDLGESYLCISRVNS